MSNEEKKMITTKEAASLLDVKPSTIHKYVKEGKLNPVYKSNWHIDATKLFYEEDIEHLKKEFVKPGITTGEAAELLGIHITTISQYIRQGLIKAEKYPYKGRELYFIQPEDIEQFKSEYEIKRKKEQKEFFDKNTGFTWFQSFKDQQGNEGNRILVDEEGNPYLSTFDSRKIALERIIEEGYSPITPIAEIDYITKRGYAKFQFSESETVYEILEMFYDTLGPRNMKLTVDAAHKLCVEIKPIYIKKDLSSEILQELENSLVEGNISKRLDGVFIDSDLDILTVAVPSELKELIKEEAEKEKVTIEELVLTILKDRFNF